MTSLAEFASLSLADLTAEIAAMQKTFPPAVAGTFSTVTRSGQVTPRLLILLRVTTFWRNWHER